MTQEKGNLSINSENFLPIIKKWLYTDKDHGRSRYCRR